MPQVLREGSVIVAVAEQDMATLRNLMPNKPSKIQAVCYWTKLLPISSFKLIIFLTLQCEGLDVRRASNRKLVASEVRFRMMCGQVCHTSQHN
jgi:hypothetical protein